MTTTPNGRSPAGPLDHDLGAAPAGRSRKLLFLLLSLTFLSLLFLLPRLEHYRPDEGLYTDAAIRMVKSGNYLTPYSASGALRFESPILPYWAVLGGYSLFGVNLFAARILFLMAGVLVIYLTYRLALTLFQHHDTALLAALISACSPLLLIQSVRSTPDVLLTASTLLALLGAARLLLRNERSWKNYAYLYVGAGLAIQSRGLLALILVLYPFMFGALFGRRQWPFRRLLEWKAVLVGILIALSWFGVMAWLQRDALVEAYQLDDLRSHMEDYEFRQIVPNLLSAVAALGVQSLPWCVLLLIGLAADRQIAFGFRRKYRLETWFLIGWLMLSLVALAVTDPEHPPLLVFLPAAAVFFGGALGGYTAASPQQWIHRILAASSLLLAVTGLLLINAGRATELRLSYGGAGLITAACLSLLLLRSRRPGACWPATACLVVSAFWAVETGLNPILAQTPAADLAARLRPEPGKRGRVYALDVPAAYQSQIRVVSRGQLTVVATEPSSLTQAGSEPVIFRDGNQSEFAGSSGAVERVAQASQPWSLREALGLLSSSSQEALLARHRVSYYIFFPE